MIRTEEKGSPSAIVKEIGDKLRELREARRLSPEDLSDRTATIDPAERVSPSYIRRLEKGTHNPTLDVLAILLQAMGMTLGRFFEYQLAGEDQSEDVQDKRAHRLLQRLLEGPWRKDVQGTLRMFERNLLP